MVLAALLSVCRDHAARRVLCNENGVPLASFEREIEGALVGQTVGGRWSGARVVVPAAQVVAPVAQVVAPVALIWQDVIATSLCDVGGGEPTRRSAGFLLRIRLFHPGSLRRDVEAAVSVACRKDFEVRSALNF